MTDSQNNILNREYKFEFFKKEIDSVLESELSFNEKERKFSRIIEMILYDSVFLLSEIKYFFTTSESYLSIFPKVIDTFHYRIYTYGGQLFDPKHNHSNPKLLDFYNEVSKHNPKLFELYENFFYTFEQKYCLGVLYWFDLESYSEFINVCGKMLKDKNIDISADIWLKEEIVRTRDSFLKIGNSISTLK